MKVGLILKLTPRIRELRTERGITQTHIAKKLDVSQQTLSKWEKGDVYPNIKQAYELASLLFVDPYELYKEE